MFNVPGNKKKKLQDNHRINSEASKRAEKNYTRPSNPSVDKEALTGEGSSRGA